MPSLAKCPFILSLYYSYYSKLAKETTIPNKTCPRPSSNLEKFILGDKYKNIHSSSAHNNKHLETAQVLILYEPPTAQIDMGKSQEQYQVKKVRDFIT